MSASNTDKLTHVGNPGTATTLEAPGHTIGGSSFNVVSTTNWPTDTGVVFATDTVTVTKGVEVRNVGSYCEWIGVVTSSTVISNAILLYGTDQNYAAGSTSRVYIPVASSRENRLVDGILTSLDQDGTLKSGAVDNAGVLASNVVTTSKVLDSNVTATKLADSSIQLGYSEITTNFTDTTATGADITVTGLSTTVTVPSATRRVKVEVSLNSALKSGSAGDVYRFKIFEDGIQRREFLWNIPGSNYGAPWTFEWSGTTTIGSHTYTFTVAQTTAGTMTIQANSGAKASTLQVTLD